MKSSRSHAPRGNESPFSAATRSVGAGKLDGPNQYSPDFFLLGCKRSLISLPLKLATI
jgi:hypothetical protein